jgi:hypothetical protein
MNRKSMILLPAVLLLSGCDERAREFASKMRDILCARTKYLQSRIDAEQTAYKNLADIFATAGRQTEAARLTNEMIERSTALSIDYSQSPQHAAFWSRDLQTYRKMFFDSQLAAVNAEIDQTASQLAALEALEIQQAQIDALDKLLATLAKKQSLADAVSQLKGFATDTSDSYDKVVCNDAQERLKNPSTSAADKATLQTLVKDKGCSTSTTK